MNEKEHFEAWSKENWMYIDVKENARVIYQAGAESKQSELDKANAELEEYRSIAENIGATIAVSQLTIANSELDKANKEVEYYLSAYNLAFKQAMDNGQARDKANARITQLEEALKDAIDDIRSWGAYASEYFQQKHNLDGDIKRYEDIVTNNQ